MLKNPFTEEISALIKKHYHDDLNSVLLQYDQSKINIDFVVNQIKSRKKAFEKFPEWAQKSQIIFPAYLSIEQSSSQWTASRKTQLFDGKSVLDLTGGMGIDAYYISQKVDSYTLLEQNQDLVEIDKHNFEQLEVKNIECIHTNSYEYLQKNNAFYDTIYIDPARRTKDKTQRAYHIEDFSPNIIEWQEILWKHTSHIVVKLAPMLDISALIKKIHHVDEVFVIAWKNEVKEILLSIRKNTATPKIHAINILDKDLKEDYTFACWKEASDVKIDSYQRYIYEPNKAILKANLQDKLAEKHSLAKLHPFTQFYTHSNLDLTFPGRIFKLIQELPSKQKNFKKLFPHKQANIISRNHPLKAKDLHRRFDLNSGGKRYIIAFKAMNKNRILEVERIK